MASELGISPRAPQHIAAVAVIAVIAVIAAVAVIATFATFASAYRVKQRAAGDKTARAAELCLGA